jgi:hypothetical protein
MADSNVEYIKLITSEYQKSENYKQYVEAFLNLISPSVDCLNNFDVLFNLNNAVGDQLDKLGELVGIGRQLPIDDPDIPATLDDETYRLVIRARILSNRWDGTIQGLRNILDALFAEVSYEIVDNQDMSYLITLISPTIDDTLVALILNGFILPKPSGVRVNYEVLDNPLFGWDSETGFIKGWDEGKWANA